MPRPASFRLTLRRAAGMAALGALLAPTLLASAPAQAARPKAPVITSVAPLELAVGQTLTLRGRNFVKGRGKNTVVFKRAGGRAVFVKADLATAKMLQVTLPAKLEAALKERDDEKVDTRFELRVLGRKLSRATPSRLSPMVAPAPDPAPAATPTPSPLAPAAAPVAPLLAPVEAAAQAEAPAPASEPAPCTRDNDLLDEALEVRLKLDPCNADSDGDGVEDGYEFRSALDLNDGDYDASRPSYTSRPYPNPLNADAAVDHDGDSLTLGEEFKLWNLTIANGASRTLDPLTYSDGEQYSMHSRAGGHRTPTLASAGYDKQTQFLNWANGAGELHVTLVDPEDDFADPLATRTVRHLLDFDRDGDDTEDAEYYDLDANDYLSDEERDEDADGLTNFAEGHNCMQRGYWKGVYDQEVPYRVDYEETDLLDADSDDDGIRDGADDQDFDDVPNVMECSRIKAAGQARVIPAPGDSDPSDDGQPLKAFVNPYNPCLPSTGSRTCDRSVPVSGTAWAPFTSGGKYFLIKN